jgi:hypothetical protein
MPEINIYLEQGVQANAVIYRSHLQRRQYCHRIAGQHCTLLHSTLLSELFISVSVLVQALFFVKTGIILNTGSE